MIVMQLHREAICCLQSKEKEYPMNSIKSQKGNNRQMPQIHLA